MSESHPSPILDQVAYYVLSRSVIKYIFEKHISTHTKKAQIER